MWLNKNGALKNTLTEWNFHDIAKLMFGFNCFWAYTSFSQYMLIWYANIPEETAWYALRMQGGWERIAMLPDRRPLHHPILGIDEPSREAPPGCIWVNGRVDSGAASSTCTT